MTWQVEITLAVLLLSVAIVLQRAILRQRAADSVAFAGVFQLLVGVLMLPLAVVNGLSFHGFNHMWLPIAICTLAFGIGSVAYARTLEHIDAAEFSVLYATHAVWVMLAGFWLYHEQLSWLQVLGTILIFASVFLLVKKWRSFRSVRALSMGLLTGLFFGIAIAGSAYVVRHTDPLTWIFASFILGGLGSLAVQPSKIPLCKDLIRGEMLRAMLIVCVVYGLGNIAMNYAYLHGPFSLVAPIRQSGIVVTALLAFVFLRDERSGMARKIIASVVCCLGVVLVV